MTTKTPSRILVPTDFSETANHALRYASELARHLGARITVVYADPFLPPVDYSATVGSWDDGTFEELKARILDELRITAETYIDPSVLYDTVVRIATTNEGIVAQARESGAGLIVMGTHGRTGFRRIAVGSVTEAIMRQSEIPVIAVPPGCDATAAIRTIVCSVRCSDQCLEALMFAASLAPEARLVVLRATSADIVQGADDLAQLRSWVPEAIAQRCDFRLLGEEHVAEQVDRVAKELHANLLVTMETADRSASDVVYGTFAVRLVQRSDCPVLTVSVPAARAARRIALQEKRTAETWADQGA